MNINDLVSKALDLMSKKLEDLNNLVENI